MPCSVTSVNGEAFVGSCSLSSFFALLVDACDEDVPDVNEDEAVGNEDEAVGAVLFVVNKTLEQCFMERTYDDCRYVPNFLFFEGEAAVVGPAVGVRAAASVPRLNVTDMRSIRRTPRSVTDLHVPSNLMQERIAGLGVLFHRGLLPSYK